MVKELDERLNDVDNRLSDAKSELEQGQMNLGLKLKTQKEQIKERKYLNPLIYNRKRHTRTTHPVN